MKEITYDTKNFHQYSITKILKNTLGGESVHSLKKNYP